MAPAPHERRGSVVVAPLKGYHVRHQLVVEPGLRDRVVGVAVAIPALGEDGERVLHDGGDDAASAGGADEGVKGVVCGVGDQKRRKG